MILSIRLACTLKHNEAFLHCVLFERYDQIWHAAELESTCTCVHIHGVTRLILVWLVPKTCEWLRVGLNLYTNLTAGVGSLAVLPLNSHGRFVSFPTVAGHSAFVTDFTFSPFDSHLLATGAEDGLVKLWQLPEELGKDEVLSSPLQTLPQETVG